MASITLTLLASPETMVIAEVSEGGRRDWSFEIERTYTVTVWLCARRAGIRREPRLPVAPRRRTRMSVERFGTRFRFNTVFKLRD